MRKKHHSFAVDVVEVVAAAAVGNALPASSAVDCYL